MNYRQDSRSNAQFSKDIEESTILERLLAKLYVADLTIKKGKKYTLIDHGCDNSGKVLPDSMVSTKADYVLVHEDGRCNKIDIKFSKPDVNTFHIKEAHFLSYKKQDCAIVMFMGVNTDRIRYTVILPKNFDTLMKTGERKTLWGKQQFRFHINDFKWIKV